VLEVRGLRVSYQTRSGLVPAVRGVDLTVAPGEVVALVGESGSGKSTTAHAIIGLLPPGGRIDGGEILFEGQDLAAASARSLLAVRGARIGLIPQDPTVSLNPVQRIGPQVAEVLRIHGLADRRTAAAAAVELLGRAGLPDPAVRARQYPHELSGGMRQRALIAIAIAAKPRLIIADEPTSALDVTVQRLILDQLASLTAAVGTAVLLVTHDLGVAADRASRILVMSQGQIVESGQSSSLLADARHPYTRKLLRAAPSLSTVVTRVPPARSAPLVTVADLSVRYALPRTRTGPREVRAVDGVSFAISPGETLALVGESGSGKSTTARALLGLVTPSSGQVLVGGVDVTRARGSALRALRRRVQLVYQNPYASLDPRFTVEQVVTEPLRSFGVGTASSRRSVAEELLAKVALPASVLRRRPTELSGGQRQRVAIARALALSPELVVLDEPVSALDVSVQSQVLDLLVGLQESTGVAYLFISHDLAVVRRIAHRVAVMRSGVVVESGTTAELFERPAHEYTRELLAAVPGQRLVGSVGGGRGVAWDGAEQGSVRGRVRGWG